jgi:hypothetical protein
MPSLSSTALVMMTHTWCTLLETPSFRVVKFSAVFFAGNLAEI